MKYAVVLCALGLMAAPLARAEFNPPVAVRTVAPVYPESMRRDHVSGIVLVNCEVDVHGDVAEPKIEKASDPAFEEPALAALRRWKFKPAQRDGAPVSTRVSIPIKFLLEG
jgi:protein TonB